MRRGLALLLVALAGAAAGTSAAARVPPPDPGSAVLPAPHSRALGKPWHGRLLDGIQLPGYGVGYLTWDSVLKQVPNRAWRRWGTAKLVAVVERVCARFAADHPGAAPVLVGDLSRPQGGVFDGRFGGLGHASHQNGLDVDVFYPRRDGLARAAWRPGQVDRVLAQELVDRFLAAGAEKIFVGPRVGLRGPPDIVQPLVHHDDHLHVRIPRPSS